MYYNIRAWVSYLLYCKTSTVEKRVAVVVELLSRLPQNREFLAVLSAELGPFITYLFSSKYGIDYLYDHFFPVTVATTLISTVDPNRQPRLSKL